VFLESTGVFHETLVELIVFPVIIGVADGEDEGGSETRLSVVAVAASVIATHGATGSTSTPPQPSTPAALTASANTVSSRTYPVAPSPSILWYQIFSDARAAAEGAYRNSFNATEVWHRSRCMQRDAFLRPGAGASSAKANSTGCAIPRVAT
jgi:hypothetical protein